MLFNNAGFYFYFPLVWVLYYSVPLRLRNPLLLGSSLFFYGNWNINYLFILLGSTVLNYGSALLISQETRESKKKLYLWGCVTANLLILGAFKYNLDVLLPIGISFYTFQALAYVIDVHRAEIRPERNFATFALFLSFFPQLVAGPIERAKDLLPQFSRKHDLKEIDWDGALRLLLQGYFKKMVIADRLATYVDSIYQNPGNSNSLTVLIALHFFTFQLYCDFSGYTDIARGVAKLLGFELSLNFRQPFLSRNLREFIQNWHITLTNWLRSYVYIPLGGNRKGSFITARNLLVIMFISGIWHGASWNFLIWGFFLGLGLVIVKAMPVNFPRWASTIITFEYWVLVTGFFFRPKSFQDTALLWDRFLTPWNFKVQYFIKAMSPMTGDLHFFSEFLLTLGLIAVLVWIDFKDRRNSIGNFACVVLLLCIVFLGRFNEKAFIYFHF